MRIIWRGASRYHNWYDKKRTIPRNMLVQALQLGLIGKVDWTAISPDDNKREVEHKADTLDCLLCHRPKRGELYRIAAGGFKPFPWKMTLALFPFRKDLGEVAGYNIISFWFESDLFLGPEGSDALVRGFQMIHNPDNTEAAFIHLYEREAQLRDLGEPYEIPVTISPMFSGIYWANFLGGGQLALFDLSELHNIKSYQVEWTDDIGLFVRVSQDIVEATSPAIEEKMLRLTEKFRAALR